MTDRIEGTIDIGGAVNEEESRPIKHGRHLRGSRSLRAPVCRRQELRSGKLKMRDFLGDLEPASRICLEFVHWDLRSVMGYLYRFGFLQNVWRYTLHGQQI